MAEAEVTARALADPVLLSRVLESRSAHENGAGRLEVADALADEALHAARAAADDWAEAMAASASAMAADSAAELRERVDLAASLLEGVGNVYHLADLLSSCAFAALCQGSDRYASELVARAMPMMRQLDNPYQWMLLRGNVALTALLTGDADTARASFDEELRLCREIVALPFASEGLAGLAAVAAVRDELDRAARLCGASCAHRYGKPEDPVDARLHATYFEPARSRHGTDAWDAAGREGAALSFEDAIAYALREHPPDAA